MNVSDIENEILTYLDENYAVRTVDLIREVKKMHTDEKGLVARGFNDKSFYRKIKEMKDSGEIIEIDSDQHDIYGIKDPDKRATYLVLKIVDDRRTFIDKILPLIKSKDDGDVLATLHEIDRYRGKYHLNSIQLDNVVFALQSQDTKIVEKSLWIIFYYMDNLKIQPSDIPLLKANVKKVLLRFCRDEIVNGNIHQHALIILGILKDPVVVDQLMIDAKRLDRLTHVAGRYREPFVAEIIEAQRSTLFEFERKLRKTKSTKSIENSAIADLISEIRSQAAHTVFSKFNENGGLMS